MNALLILSAGGAIAFLVWFGRWVGRAMGYAFCNATVSARESKILAGARLDEITGAPDIRTIYPSLEERGLRVKIAENGGIDWLETERAFHESVSREISEILEIVPGDAKPIVRRLAGYREMINLKVVVTGLHEGAAKDEIASRLIPCPTDLGRFELLASAGSIEGLLEFLKGSEYYDALAGAMDDYRRHGLAPLISAIERSYYSKLWETAKKSKELIRIFGLWIDSVNLTTAMRLRRSGLQPDRIGKYLILPGYGLTEGMIRAFVSESDLRSAVHSIRITEVGRFLQEHVEELEVAGLEEIEKMLRGLLLATCRFEAMRNFFSACPVVSYILQRETEVENVRTVLRMRAAGFPPEEVRRRLITG